MTRPQTRRGSRAFRADLRLATDTIRRQPVIAGVTALLAGVQGMTAGLPPDETSSATIAAAVIPFGLFAIGWAGTERLAYLRLWQKEPLTGRELWWRTWKLLLPVGRLALLVVVPTVLAAVGINELLDLAGAPLPFPAGIMTVVALVLGIVLTFSLPAVVFTTSRARTALRAGMSLVVRTWPRNAWHVLVPAAFFAASVSANLPILAPTSQVFFAMGWALLGLLFKGAIAALYLREEGAEKHGMAPWDPQTESPRRLDGQA